MVEILEIKFACITNYAAKTIIENHIYHYTIPCEMIIYGSDGVTGNHILR
jgi:hypothetical protein